jgi:large repetitive protein
MPTQISHLQKFELSRGAALGARALRSQALPLMLMLFSFASQAFAQGTTVSGTVTNGPSSTLKLSGAAPTLVQSTTGSSSAGVIQTTASFTSIAGAGNAIVVFVRYGGTAISSIQDNLNNSYIAKVGPTQWGVAPNSTDRYATVFVASNIAGGHTITITITLAGASTHDTYVAALEYSGVSAVNPVNATALGTGTYASTGAPATGNMTTTVTNAKLVATAWDSNEAYTSNLNGTGYSTDVAAEITSISGGSGYANLTEDSTAPTAGVWNATTGAVKTVDWVIQAVALTPASASQITSADGAGNYSFSNVNNGTYSVIPSSPNYSFNPAYQTVQVSGTPISGVNFTATSTTGSISGTISPASDGSGATVTLSGAVPTLVQTAGHAVSAGNSSISLNFASLSNAGDAIVVFLRFGGTTVSSITDSQSNTYTPAVGPINWGTAGGGATDRYAEVFVAKNIVGGALNLTVNLTGSSTHGFYAVAVDYSGVDLNNPVNASASGVGTVSVNGSPKTANMNTSAVNTKLVATSWDSNDSYTSTGNGSGYTTNIAAGVTSVSGGGGWGNLTEDETASAAGIWNATASNLPAVVDWAIQVVALTPGASQTTTAEGSGDYIFNSVLNGIYTVTPSKSGETFTPQSQQVTVNGTNITSVNFSTNAGIIAGHVTDAQTGSPIQGATVSYSGGVQTATTDQNGNYQLTNIAPGTYNVTASASNHQASTQSTAVTSGNTATANFVLNELGAITGSVKNTSGTAIPNATVSYSGGSTSTDVNGNYTLNNVVAGIYNITASAATYNSSTQNATVISGKTATLNFTLSLAAGTIAGKVTDNQTGQPIQGATVSYSGGSQTAVTDLNGNYRLTTISPGTYNVAARAAGYQSATLTNVTVTANTTTTTNLALNELGKITGFVKNSAGAALAGATVSFSGGTTTTAADGGYTLSNVVPGSYNVTATAPNYKSSTKSTTVNPGQTTMQNFNLSPQTGGIKGRITNTSGVVLQGATVSVSGGIIATTKSTTTDKHGNYSFSGLPVGNYTVTASKTGYTTQQTSTKVSSSTTSTVNVTLN